MRGRGHKGTNNSPITCCNSLAAPPTPLSCTPYMRRPGG